MIVFFKELILNITVCSILLGTCVLLNLLETVTMEQVNMFGLISLIFAFTKAIDHKRKKDGR